MTQTKERQLVEALFQNDLGLVEVLANDPNIDLNKLVDYRKTNVTVFYPSNQGEFATKHVSQRPVDYQKTALHVACIEGNEAAVALLLRDPRLDPNVQDQYGITPFYEACINGKASIVAMMTKNPKVDINRPTKNGVTPVDVIVRRGYLLVMQYLLLFGRNVNTKGTQEQFGFTDGAFRLQKLIDYGRSMATQPAYYYDTEEADTRKRLDGPKCADLLELYENDPYKAKRLIREVPEIRESMRVVVKSKY